MGPKPLAKILKVGLQSGGKIGDPGDEAEGKSRNK